MLETEKPEIKNAKDFLITARKLIEKPENWAQAWYYYDRDNKRAHLDSGSVVRWCSVGACLYVKKFNLEDPLIENILDTALSILDKVMQPTVALFNDSHTHSEVMEAFDKAIESASKA